MSAATTSTTITPISTSPGSYGANSSFIATVLSTSAGTVGGPLGTVTFYVNNVAQQTVALTTLSSSISSISSGTGGLFQINTTSTAGLANGDMVTLSGTGVTDGTFGISNLTSTSFTLTGQPYTSSGSNSGTWTLANGSAAVFTSKTLPVGTDSIEPVYNSALSGTISAASSSGPIVVTSNSTAGLVNGEAVYVYGATGDTAANGFWTISGLSGNQFTLTGSSGNGTYSGGGAWLLEPNYSNSYSPTAASFVVTQGTTTTTLQPPTAVTYGQPITLTATVQNNNASAPATSGSVVFVSVGTFNSSGSISSVSGSAGGPIQINTSNTAGLSAGSWVTVQGTGTSADGTFYVSSVVTNNSFTLYNSLYTGGTGTGSWAIDNVLGVSNVSSSGPNVGTASLTLTKSSPGYPGGSNSNSNSSTPVAAAYVGNTNLASSGSQPANQVVNKDADLGSMGPVSFVISAPSAVTQSSAFNITVTAYDQYGNVATAYTGTVNLTATDPSSGISPNNTMLSSGTGTFTVVLNDLGTWTITARDTTNSSETGTSGSITVNKGSVR